MKQAYQLPDLMTIYVDSNDAPSNASPILSKPAIQYLPDGVGGWKLPDIVPSRVTKRQALLALLSISIRDVDIKNIIETMPEAEREKATIEFNHANHFERSNSMINVIATAKNLDASAVDKLFMMASKL